MSKTIEIPDIAQWEENDSELAKYTIQKQNYEMEEAEEYIKYLKNKIDKAIECIENRNTTKSKKERFMTGTTTLSKVLDILRGEDNG